MDLSNGLLERQQLGAKNYAVWWTKEADNRLQEVKEAAQNREDKAEIVS